jgi:hypothetical protein
MSCAHTQDKNPIQHAELPPRQRAPRRQRRAPPSRSRDVFECSNFFDARRACITERRPPFVAAPDADAGRRCRAAFPLEVPCEYASSIDRRVLLTSFSISESSAACNQKSPLNIKKTQHASQLRIKFVRQIKPSQIK